MPSDQRELGFEPGSARFFFLGFRRRYTDAIKATAANAATNNWASSKVRGAICSGSIRPKESQRYFKPIR